VFQIGQALLAGDPEFEHLLSLTGGTLTRQMPTVTDACRAL
jgi:hypothetical protein